MGLELRHKGFSAEVFRSGVSLWLVGFEIDSLGF